MTRKSVFHTSFFPSITKKKADFLSSFLFFLSSFILHEPGGRRGHPWEVSGLTFLSLTLLITSKECFPLHASTMITPRLAPARTQSDCLEREKNLIIGFNNEAETKQRRRGRVETSRCGGAAWKNEKKKRQQSPPSLFACLISFPLYCPLSHCC